MAISWDDLQQYGIGPGIISEAKAQNQTPDQVLQQQQQGALAAAIQAANGPAFGPYSGAGGSNQAGQGPMLSPGINAAQAGKMAQSILGATGGGGGGQPAMGTTVDPRNYLGNLGTLAMRRAMGSEQIPVVGNPQPQSGDLSQGGIANVPGPSYTNPTTQALQQGVFGGTGQGQISGGQPGIFAKATAAQPTQPWAYNPTPQATAAQPQQATPFALPPAAPTAQTAGIGLAGPPSAPTPNMGMMGMMGMGGGPTSFSQLSSNHPAITYQSGHSFGSISYPGPGQMTRMHSGGPVQGQGGSDTVPAMLTPGEFVMNKAAVQNIGLDVLSRANRGQPVQHLADGGAVQDYAMGTIPYPTDPGQIQDYAMGTIPYPYGTRSVARQRSAQQGPTVSQGQPRQWSSSAPAAQQSAGYSGAPQMTMQEHDWMMQRPPGYGDTQQQDALQAAMQAARQRSGGQTVGQYAADWNRSYQAGLNEQDPFAPGSTFDVTAGGGPQGAVSPQMGGAIAGGIGAIGQALQQMFKGPPSWKPIKQAFGNTQHSYPTPQFEPEGD